MPLKSDTVNIGGASVTLNVIATFATAPFAAVTLTVPLYVPACNDPNFAVTVIVLGVVVGFA